LIPHAYFLQLYKFSILAEPHGFVEYGTPTTLESQLFPTGGKMVLFNSYRDWYNATRKYV